jgi:DNA helicase II / ATP-dependent DNA helicase PcrA
MNDIILSPQQAAFVQWVRDGSGSAILEAVAGAGKTFSIMQAIKATDVPCAVLAYNKKIADEISGKLQRDGIDWKKAKAGTVHSFGFGALRKTFSNIKVSEYKTADLLELNHDFGLPAYRGVLCQLVSLAKQRAIGINSRIDDVGQWLRIIDHYDIMRDVEDEMDHSLANDIVQAAIKTLQASNEQTDVIDFDDMVYLPVLLRCRFWQYGLVFVDEAQDTNPARRALVRAVTLPRGRVVAVGDPCQAIYGFTGADNDSLEQFATDFGAIRLPLTVSYRCPKHIVDFSRQWVDHITAADNAIDGTVSSEDWSAFVERSDLNGNAAILCRNTKPLVQTAFALIRRKIACRIEGREIGKQLAKLATRWKQIKTLPALQTKLIDYAEREKQKAIERRQETRAQVIEDQVDTLLVIIDACRSAGKDSTIDVVNYIDELFADNIAGILTLSTIHKSKGREWERVFWLNRHATCPSKYARQEWQKDQERNLMYVAATRAIEQLIELFYEPEPKEQK